MLRPSGKALFLFLLLSLAVPEARAWPTPLMRSLARDARRLVPVTLARLIAEREDRIFEERFPQDLGQVLAADLQAGELQPETLAALEAHVGEAAELLRERRISEGVVRLGALLRIPADLADPVLSVGPEGYPPGVAREYYAFIEENLRKIPVVIDDEAALKLGRPELRDYWRRILGRSRSQSSVIRTELYANGKLVDHRLVDFRSPVYGVASLSYSRAVTAIAATWLALWREARGDVTRMPTPVEVRPVGPRLTFGPAASLPRAPRRHPSDPSASLEAKR